jgi:hypothetical protein
VHCFYLKVINKALYGQNHCLLPIENSHNQSQQVKTRTAQKGSNLAGNCRRQAGYFRIKTRRVQPLPMPVVSRSFVQQMPDFILQMPDFSAPQQLVIF